MSDAELGEQLVRGLKQLNDNLKLTGDLLLKRGIHAHQPVFKQYQEAMKLGFVNQALKAVSDE